jgi:hypothetical protein
MDGAGAALSTALSPWAPTEVVATGHGGGDLLSGPLRLRLAHAATPFSSTADRALAADPLAQGRHAACACTIGCVSIPVRRTAGIESPPLP